MYLFSPSLSYCYCYFLGGYWAVKGSTTVFWSCRNRMFFGGGGVIKRVKLPTPSSSAICYEMYSRQSLAFHTGRLFPRRCSCRHDLSKDGCYCCCKGAEEAAIQADVTGQSLWTGVLHDKQNEHIVAEQSRAEGHCWNLGPWQPGFPRPNAAS